MSPEIEIGNLLRQIEKSRPLGTATQQLRGLSWVRSAKKHTFEIFTGYNWDTGDTLYGKEFDQYSSGYTLDKDHDEHFPKYGTITNLN